MELEWVQVRGKTIVIYSVIRKPRGDKWIHFLIIHDNQNIFILFIPNFIGKTDDTVNKYIRILFTERARGHWSLSPYWFLEDLVPCKLTVERGPLCVAFCSCCPHLRIVTRGALRGEVWNFDRFWYLWVSATQFSHCPPVVKHGPKRDEQSKRDGILKKYYWREEVRCREPIHTELGMFSGFERLKI